MDIVVWQCRANDTFSPAAAYPDDVCRPIRVRYTCFSGVLTRMPALPDRYRSSPNIENWWARSDSNRGPRDSLDPAVPVGVDYLFTP